MDLEQRTTIRQILEPGSARGDPAVPVEIEWDRLQIDRGIYADTWHLRLRRPVFTVTFAVLRRCPDGQWGLTVTPKGSGRGPTLYARYATQCRAIQQIERWAQANWRRVPEQPLGHGQGKHAGRPSRDRFLQRPAPSASVDEIGAWMARHE